MTNFSRKDAILLILLTVFWGLNWPVMKLGLQDFPPITFRVLSMVGALPILYLVVKQQKAPIWLTRKQFISVFYLCIPNMLLLQLCMVIGIKAMESSGRAAILCYTMPVWAVLAGLLFYRDNLSARAWSSVFLALSGALLLLATEFSSLSGQPFGTGVILFGAVAWGCGTVFLKRNTLGLPTISITFWMMVMGTSIMLLLALLFERHDWHSPTSVEWGTILYNTIFVFGFAYAIWFRLASTLPPVASTLSVMMIPVLGVFSAGWILGESPHWQDYAAIVLILISMSMVLLKPKPKIDTTRT